MQPVNPDMKQSQEEKSVRKQAKRIMKMAQLVEHQMFNLRVQCSNPCLALVLYWRQWLSWEGSHLRTYDSWPDVQKSLDKILNPEFLAP